MQQRGTSALPGRGFTLIELIVTVSIAAILMAIAVPSFQSVILNSRRTTFVNDIVSAMQLARSEAILRSAVVTVCPSTNGTSCSSSAADWGTGWLVFADTSPFGAVGSGDQILRIGRAQGQGFSVSANRVSYSFKPLNPTSNAGLQSNGTITICDARGAEEARAVIVATNGRVRTSAQNAANESLVCG